MDLPKGQTVISSRSPAMGTHKVKLSGRSHFRQLFAGETPGGEFSVTWTNDIPLDQGSQHDWLTQYLHMLSIETPGAKVFGEGAIAPDRWWAIVGNEATPLGIGVVHCDPRFQILIEFSLFFDIDRQAELARSSLGSIRCEVTDANRVALRAATRLPAGFGSLPIGNGQFIKSMYGEALGVRFFPGEITPGDAHRAMASRIFASLDPETPASAIVILKAGDRLSDRKPLMSKARLPSKQATVYLGSTFCPADDVSLLMVLTGTGISDGHAWGRLAQVDCPGTVSWGVPEFSAVVERACADGIAAACEAIAKSSAP